MKTIPQAGYSIAARQPEASHYNKKDNTFHANQNELAYCSDQNTSGTLLRSQNTILFTSNNRLVETLCNKIIQLVYDETITKTCYSKLLSKTLNYNYTYLSNLFSSIKGTTIQQFIIYHKIERVKKLLAKGERNLTDISFELNYSSVAHLSNQFKKVTGLSPTQFKLTRQMQTDSDS